jgi:hypothetical protein
MGQQMVKYMVFNIQTWGFPIKVGDLNRFKLGIMGNHQQW